MPNYKLINPYIKCGKMDTTVVANSPEDAATMLWENLSESFVNNVPSFAFTIQDGGKKMYHYLVNEELSGGDYSDDDYGIGDDEYLATYSIKRIDNVDQTNSEKLLKNISEMNSYNHDYTSLKGGRKHKHKHHKYNYDDDDSSSSSSSSSSSTYKSFKRYYNNYPISWWWYYPGLYTYDSIYIPNIAYDTFYPYVEIYL